MLIKGQSRLPQMKGPILIVQLGDIGDVVLSLPAVVSLKQYFPVNNIWVCVREKAAALLEDVLEIAGTLIVDTSVQPQTEVLCRQWNWIRELRRHGFAMIIDLRTGSRGSVIAAFSGAAVRLGRLDHGSQTMRKKVFTHLVRPDPILERKQHAAVHHLNLLGAVGIPGISAEPFIPISAKKLMQAKTLLEKEGVPPDRPKVAVSPFSLWRYKEWRMDSWRCVIDDIVKKKGHAVIITGAPGERERADELIRSLPEGIFNLAGKTDIGILPALMHACRLFIGVDSGSLHVAAASGTPTISLFGPSSADTWAPRGERHLVVTNDGTCIPCRDKGCEGKGASRCLDTLDASKVWEKVEQLLSPPASSSGIG